MKNQYLIQSIFYAFFSFYSYSYSNINGFFLIWAFLSILSLFLRIELIIKEVKDKIK